MHLWHFATSHVVSLVYYHTVFMYFIFVYISGEVPSLSFRQMPNIVYIHDFRRRWPSVYFHWSVIQFQFGAIFYMHIFFNFHYTLELVIIYNPLCYNFMFGCLCICTRSNNRNWIKKDEKTPFCVTILGRCFNSMSFPGC